MNRETAIQIRLDKVARAFDDNVSVERVENVARILCEELSDEQIEIACSSVERRERRFPPPAVFLEYGRGSLEDEAEVAFGDFVRAIRGFGYADPEGAAQSLGPVAWNIVRRLGGWYYLCTDSNVNLGVLKKQFTDSYRATSRSAHRQEQIQELAQKTNPLGITYEKPAEDQRRDLIDRQFKMLKQGDQ